MLSPMEIILIAAVIILFIYVVIKKEKYQLLGADMNPFHLGTKLEPNADCLAYPGNQFCMMTDGTPGVCVQNGLCTPDFLIDQLQYTEDIKMPLCTRPVFPENCLQFVKCKEMQGTYSPKDRSKNLEGCQATFYPGQTGGDF